MRVVFTPALFTFLRQLKTHNTREWFQANRDRYDKDVEAPMLQFIAEIGPRLKRINPALVADPRRTGGSMFRIYRDTRFSADKSPYKTAVAARFPHEQMKKDTAAPGLYLHLEPAECFGGGGIYHPDPATLTAIRLQIVEEPKRWAAVRKTGLEIEGDSLKRAPSGFDPAHPFIEDLKRKDLYTLESFTIAQVTARDFQDRYLDAAERTAPLLGFMTRALGWRW